MKAPYLDISSLPFEPSHPDKVLYPDVGYTKGEVLAYFDRVADVLLPQLRGRPLVLRRFPDGIEESGFFQKQVADYFPDWIRTVDVPLRTERRTVRHVVCDDRASLLYLADQAVLELHAWTAPVDHLDRPDRMVVDLDPPEGTSVADLRAATRRVGELMTTLGLIPYVQSTGGRGFHVQAPLDGSIDDRKVLHIAQEIAEHLERKEPERFTTNARKDARGGRMFLDVARNSYGQTSIAAYSPRARAGAPVAVALNWNELSRTNPAGYDLTSMPRRLAQKKDPWSEFSSDRRSAADARSALSAA